MDKHWPWQILVIGLSVLGENSHPQVHRWRFC